MALLNRRLKEKDVDQLPFIEKSEKVVVDLDEDEDSHSVFVHHGITLWVSDAVVMLIQHIQIFALILAMGERWGYPADFVRYASFAFLFNLDLWEFTKVVISEAYQGPPRLDTFLESSAIGIQYNSYLIGWTAAIAAVGFGFLVTYIIFLYRKPLYLLLHVARMKRIFSVLMQVTCLPIGIAFARVFHCRSDLTWNVQDNIQCYTTEHWIYVGIAVLVGILVFLAYPINMIRKIRGQVICYSAEKHEGYLQLKEAEYNQGLDILWAVGQFHLFSSFRRLWIYYKPIMFTLKFSLICYYAPFLYFTENNPERFTLAEKLLINIPIFIFFFLVFFGLFSSGLARPPLSTFKSFMSWCCWKGISRLLHVLFNITSTWLVAKIFFVLLACGLCVIDNLGGGIGALLSMLSLIMVRSPPFRIVSFNFMILFCLVVNTVNAYVGVMVEMFNTNEIVNAFFAPPIPETILIWLNVGWTCVAILWVAFLIMRYLGIIFPRQPLWPTLTTDGKSEISEETKKYMRAVLKGRHTLEKALSSPPIFAPVHELERQIHIINAYCREAEYIDDPTFDSLWDLLDELIEAHRTLAPQSLFALTKKKTIRETAKEFMMLMPQMRKRLDQREYDFILMNPMKKRMLLKMYVLGTFVNGRMDKVKQEVEQKVYKVLQEAAETKTPSLYGSSTAFDWDSMMDLTGTYGTIDMLRTTSSSGESRPQTTVSLSSRPDSVEKLLDEVEDWEEGQGGPIRKKKISANSMPLIMEHPSTPSGFEGSSASIPGQVSYDDDRAGSVGRSSPEYQTLIGGDTSERPGSSGNGSTQGSQTSLRSIGDKKPLL